MPNSPFPARALHSLAGLLDQGIREFNIGRYWHAHEDWEKAWLRLAGAEKSALQGLIQASASFYLLDKSRFRPAASLAASALGKLELSRAGVSTAENRVEIPGLEDLLREVAGESQSPESIPGHVSGWLSRARKLRAFRHRGAPITGNSRRVDSTQIGPHPDLEARIATVLQYRHELRVSDEDRVRFEALDAFVRKCGMPVILDSGCGTGASSERLAELHPESLVIGVDRSPHRLGKAVSRLTGAIRGEWSSDRADALEIAPGILRLGDRLVIAQFELSRFWALIVMAKWPVTRNHLLYPNPWPKPNALRRRWHGHEVFPTLVRVSPELELRSNWLIYLEEFHDAFRIATGREGTLETVTPLELKEPLTPFERKYRDSGHDLWRWRAGI